MYEKLTSKLRKGYRVLKNSSKSLRKCSQTVASSSRKLHQSSQYAIGKDGSAEHSPSPFQRHSEEDQNSGSEVTKLRHFTDSEKRWQSILGNDLYKNWLRVGLALRSTCDVVAPIVDKVLVDFHLELREKYSDLPIVNSRNDLIREVLRFHKRPISKSEVWKRSDVNKWLEGDDGPWEIAKVFLPKGSWGSSRMTTARSLDVTGMLNLMTSFQPFENYVSNLQQVQRVIQIRNRTMHSPRLEFTQDELEHCFDGIHNLLHDVILNLYLSECPEYENAVEDIKKIKDLDFNLATTIKSSFEVLEERLATENHTDLPSPSAMSTNRELLRSLRQVFSSGEVAFAVDTQEVQEKLDGLERLLGEQQILAEEKITMLFRRANYLQQQLDRIKRSFTLDNTNSSPTGILEEEQISHTSSQNTTNGKGKKRNRKGRKKRRNAKDATFSTCAQTKSTQKRGSKVALNLKTSRLNMKSMRGKPARPRSVPNLASKKLSVYKTSSVTKFLHPDQGVTQQTMRFMSSSNNEDDNPTTSQSKVKSAWEAESFLQDSNGENRKGLPENSSLMDADVPGPSGLQSKKMEGKTLRKRKSSTSLVPFDAIKKKLMGPIPTFLGKSDKSGDSTEKFTESGRGAAKDSSVARGSAGNTGGTSSGEGHFQHVLSTVLKQSSSRSAVYEDKKDGEFFVSTVRFQSKFAVKSRDPVSTAAVAETQAAVEALRKFGLEVADNKNAKPVMNRFCEAAVGSSPSYFSFNTPSKLHLSVVQVHSLFSTWGGLKDRAVRDFPQTSLSKGDIILQVKCADPTGCSRETMEQNCARIALADANIASSEILNLKRAANELCLRQGGTLPIYETTEHSKSQGLLNIKRVTTMTSLHREKFSSLDNLTDNESVNSSDWFSDDATSDDIVMGSSSQPAYSQENSEEFAAKALLEKMGVVVGYTASETHRQPYGQVLRENAVHWGYHPPQYHTFEVKPAIDLGELYFAVVSSKAFHKLTAESLSAESDRNMTTIQDARESAARKALLMLGYPQTFYK